MLRRNIVALAWGYTYHWLFYLVLLKEISSNTISNTTRFRTGIKQHAKLEYCGVCSGDTHITEPQQIEICVSPLFFDFSSYLLLNTIQAYNIGLQLTDRHQSSSLCPTNQELRLLAYRVSQKNNDIGKVYFFLPSPFPLSFFRPRTHLNGYYFCVSPIFHCHKIKDGGYNNTNTNKVSPTQNTPALQAKKRPFSLPLHSLVRSRETHFARPNRRACSQATYHGNTHITVTAVQIEIRATCHTQSDGLCYMWNYAERPLNIASMRALVLYKKHFLF